MAKSADAFRTISEVADWLETPAHVLRFWESKFRQLKPVKRAGGRRYYRPSDMMLIGGIKKLLHTDGMTIKGVQKLLREQGVKHVAGHSQPLDDVTAAEVEDNTDIGVSETVSPPAETVMDFQRGELDATPPHPVAFKVASPDAADAATSEGTPEPTDQEAPEDTLSDEDNADSSDESSVDQDNAPEIGTETEEETDDIEAEISEPETQTDNEDEPPVMPGFSHREPEPEPEQEPEQEVLSDPEHDEEPEAALNEAAPARKIVELPADPEDGAPAEPGILTTMVELKPPVSNEMADRLGLVLERLRQSGSKNDTGQGG